MTLRLAAMTFCALFALAGAANALDFAAADISGVHLYMTKDQVISVLKSRFPGKPLSSFMEDRTIGNGKYLKSISVDNGVYDLRVTFSERAPLNGFRPEVVSSVYLELESSDKDAIQHFHDDAVAKYNAPTGTNGVNWMIWCNDPGLLEHDYQGYNVPGSQCSKSSVRLLFNFVRQGFDFESGLSLVDRKVQTEASDYQDNQEKNTIKSAKAPL